MRHGFIRHHVAAVMPANALITPRLAEEMIGARLQPRPVETLPLTECVGGTLREDICAERDQPPFDRVAMDGIAGDSDTWRRGQCRLKLQGVQAAGAPQTTLARKDHAIEVMTGAILPVGCDCVVPVEQIDVDDGYATIRPSAVLTPFHNVHRRGSDARGGSLLLACGARLRAPEIAIAASAGKAHVRVSRQPAVAVVSTGDELVEPGERIADFQVRRSNAYAIVAALLQRGFNRVTDHHIRDDETELTERLALLLRAHDVLILSGGVSMGRFDFVPRVLKQLGVAEVFHRIAQRPGAPMWFGTGPNGQAVFGLPGNPVSTLTCLIRYVTPAIAASMGSTGGGPEPLALAAAVTVEGPRAYFLPVRIQYDDSGWSWAQPRPTNGSGDFLSLAGTDGFIELPPGPDTYPRGFITTVRRW